MKLDIHWPNEVSALAPVPVEVELIPPPGVSVPFTVSATVFDPAGAPYWLSDLIPRSDNNILTAREPLQLPLEPREGDWRLMVRVQSSLAVEGDRQLTFRPKPISFREKPEELPAAMDVRIPQAFSAEIAVGDNTSGGRTWRYGDGELGLWWAPGPTEPLLLNNALVMLEATYDADTPPEILDVEETTLQAQPTFIFHEEWPGEDGGPAKALVTQGPDYWLYVWRVQAEGKAEIPPLLQQVWETFTFIEE